MVEIPVRKYALHLNSYLPFNRVVGTQQSDRIGPVIFSLALHISLTEISTLIKNDIDTQDCECTLAVFCMDERVIIGGHSVLQNSISSFSSSTCIQHGLHISIPKSYIWWPVQPSEIIKAQVTSNKPPMVL